jgi:hypothetical protein
LVRNVVVDDFCVINNEVTRRVQLHCVGKDLV